LEYYRVGPIIVEKINECMDSDSIYTNLWNKYLMQCCKLQKEKRFKEALDIYIEMVKMLCDRYKIELNDSIVSKFEK